MTNKEIIDNAPKGATHVAFYDHNDDVKYLQTDTDVINYWYHWVDGTRHMVDYDFTVVFNNMRSLADIKQIVELEQALETQSINALY
jgi:hypothetical protein